MDDEQALAARLEHVGVDEAASSRTTSSAHRAQSPPSASTTEVFAPDVFARRRARPQPSPPADAALDALRVRPSAPVLAPRLSRGLSQEDVKDTTIPSPLLGTAPSGKLASPLTQSLHPADGPEREPRSAPPVVDFSQLPSDASAAVSVEEESKGKDTVRSLPSTAALNEAGRAVVYKENGTGIKFGELFASRKTLVIFTSDWHEQSLEPYLKMLCNVNMASLGKAGVSLILVGQGSVAEMTTLQEVVPVPFSLYTDVDRSVYRALGMDHPLDGIRSRKRSKASLRKNLLHMAPQRHVLGGEFLLGPGLRCSFAHRLSTGADHTDVARLLQIVGVSNPMLPLRQQIDPVDRARAQLETVDYWSAEKPYYSNANPKPKGKMAGKKASQPNLRQESKSRLSLFWKKQSSSKPLEEALPNYTEGLHNPDPFAAEQPAEPRSSWRGERPLRKHTQLSSSSSVAPEEGRAPPGEGVPPPRPGKPDKISVRQLTTAALQPMAEP